MVGEGNAATRAQLIERGDGWWALVEDGGAWRSLGRFSGEAAARQAARAQIGEDGLIDLLQHDEARAERAGVEDIADVAEAELDQEVRSAQAEAQLDRSATAPAPPNDLDPSTSHAD